MFLVEDESHSDFIALRTMIIKTNLNHLRDVTHFIHYENYRFKKLSSFHSNEHHNGKTISNSFINKYFDTSLSLVFSSSFVLLEMFYHKLKMKN